MILSFDFENDTEFEKAQAILKAKNADSQILNISLSVDSAVKANELRFELEFEGIKFSSNLYA